METTPWENYGRKSGNEKCQDCMVHCGYEATAVDHTFSSMQGLRGDGRGHADRQAVDGRGMSLEGWVPEIGPYLTLGGGDRVRLRLPGQHDDRPADGTEMVGYLFNRDRYGARALRRVLRRGRRGALHAPLRRDRQHQVHRQGHRGRATRWKAWLERKEREKAEHGPRPARRRVNGILILTAVELEARGLARELELPPCPVLPFRRLRRAAAPGRAGRPAGRPPRRALAAAARRARRSARDLRAVSAAASRPTLSVGRARRARERARARRRARST